MILKAFLKKVKVKEIKLYRAFKLFYAVKLARHNCKNKEFARFFPENPFSLINFDQVLKFKI
jgi:hypothetical protein